MYYQVQIRKEPAVTK